MGRHEVIISIDEKIIHISISKRALITGGKQG